MPSNVKKSWVDPLTFREMKVGDRVKLNSENDIIVELTIEDIYDDDSILLKKPDAVVISALKSTTVVMHPQVKINAAIFKQNDKVIVKTRDNKAFQMKIEMILNKNFIVLGPVGGAKKIGLLDKLKLLWR